MNQLLILMASMASATCVVKNGFEAWKAHCVKNVNNKEGCMQHPTYCRWEDGTTTEAPVVTTTTAEPVITTTSKAPVVTTIVPPHPPGPSPATTSRYVTYIDELKHWWPQTEILSSLGVPQYNKNMKYNVVNIAFWIPRTGADDVALLWKNPMTYFDGAGIGNNKDEVLTKIRQLYNDGGVKIMLSAFGATAPASFGNWPDPAETCNELADFVLEHHFDGVDLDYECNDCMNKGLGENWLIKCTRVIREKLPASKGYLLTHAPQAPYFNGDRYNIGGGYLKVNQEVGHLIDWYNIQFYNQEKSSYDTCDTLFKQSEGWATQTSVQEMVNNGVDVRKIVIGKPATTKDVMNTGYMNPGSLKNCIKEAQVNNKSFKTGFMTWQFSNDSDSSFASTVIEGF